MKTVDNVGVTFADTVIGRGHIDKVVNVQLGVFQFSSSEDGKVDLDPAVTCRLRMGLDCAKQLREALDWVIERIDPGVKVNIQPTSAIDKKAV